MSSVLLALCLAEGVELDFEARPLKSESGHELQISGKARGLSEGAILRLRFRRIVNRLEGTVLAGRPEEASWVRRVAVRRGAFSLREVLPAPGEVEVEVAFDPAEQEKTGEWRGRDPVAVAKIFHAAPPIETASALRREVRSILAVLAEARRYGEEGGKARAARRLAALREEEPRAVFAATNHLLAEVIEGFLAPAWMRGPHGHSLGIDADELAGALDWAREVFGRERAALMVREAVRPGMVEKALEISREAAAGDEALLDFLRSARDGGFAARAAAFEARVRQGR